MDRDEVPEVTPLALARARVAQAKERLLHWGEVAEAAKAERRRGLSAWAMPAAAVGALLFVPRVVSGLRDAFAPRRPEPLGFFQRRHSADAVSKAGSRLGVTLMLGAVLKRLLPMLAELALRRYTGAATKAGPRAATR